MFTVAQVKENWLAPVEITLGADKLIPLRAGEQVGWRIVWRDEMCLLEID
jgi:dihydroorotase